MTPHKKEVISNGKRAENSIIMQIKIINSKLTQ